MECFEGRRWGLDVAHFPLQPQVLAHGVPGFALLGAQQRHLLPQKLVLSVASGTPFEFLGTLV